MTSIFSRRRLASHALRTYSGRPLSVLRVASFGAAGSRMIPNFVARTISFRRRRRMSESSSSFLPAP